MEWLKIDENYYLAEDGSTIKREYGKTPNGNSLNGQWVYRDKSRAMVDFDQYRSDLCSRHKIKLESFD